MNTSADIARPFEEFAGTNGSYYADVFLRIQKFSLPGFHVNLSAMLGSFVWAALRGNWLLFTIAFAIDLVAAVNAALVYKYSKAAIENAEKAYLVERYEGWANGYLIAAILVFVLGRLCFAWMADRLYSRQYEKWRINHNVSSGLSSSRLLIAALITVLIVPLMIYRATQFAPDARSCIKQDRAIAQGEIIAFKERFDCFVIGEFPTLFWIDRPDEITFPRGEDGNRIVKHTPPSPDAPPVNLNTYTSQTIDDAIGYLTVFYGFLFDGITQFLRTMLTAITSVFVGTPWPITMGVLLFVAYRMAGPKVAIFVGVSLIYLAIFGFWLAAMDTLSLVVAASIICVVMGLPLGIWVGKSKRGQAIVTPILDVMQTIPSFVYLLPAIAFFSIGKPPGILATVIFAMPPDGPSHRSGNQACPREHQGGRPGLRCEPQALTGEGRVAVGIAFDYGRDQSGRHDESLDGGHRRSDRCRRHGIHRDRGAREYGDRQGRSRRHRDRSAGDDDRPGCAEGKQDPPVNLCRGQLSRNHQMTQQGGVK